MKANWLQIIFNALIMLSDIQQLLFGLFKAYVSHIKMFKVHIEQDLLFEEVMIQLKDLF